jgi:cytochrome d ubiquinol oxidase subunit I
MTVDLSRWQFALTTLIHYSVVAASIGLTFLVAVMQWRWHRTGDETWLRLTKYYARAMVVSFGVGVVTGILQTFQFGMNWAGFSTYAGDIFGAPLALEGLAAFFVESVFLGLWIFGWGRLGRRTHLACIWIVAAATVISAWAILSANTWMQGPRGYEIVDGRAELTNVASVFLNVDVALTVSHVVLTALLTGSVIVLAIAALNLRRGRETAAFTKVATLACTVGLLAGSLGLVAGHFQGVRAVERQPMKMAAAEALYETASPAPFSVFAVGRIHSDPGEPFLNVELPGGLSLINDLSLSSTFQGIDDLQKQYERQYGPGDYTPVVPLMYWSFRLMVGAGTALVLFMAFGLWTIRRGRLLTSPRFLRLATLVVALPFAAQVGGWLLREGGRQPWIIQGLLKTEDAGSTVGAGVVAFSLVVFLGIYLVTVAVAARGLRRELAAGLPEPEPDTPAEPDRGAGASTGSLALTY